MRTPRNDRTSSGLALLDDDVVAGRCRQVDRAVGAQMKNGTSLRAASTASVYVPTLLAVSPLAATRSAPTRIEVDLAARHQVPGGHVGEQRVRHARLGQLPGRQPGALQVRPRLVDPDVDRAAGVVGGLDDPEGGPVLAAGERPGVAVGQDVDRPVRERRQQLEPEPGQPAVIGRRLEDDRVGLGAHRVGDRPAVIGQVADLLVASHHALDRPAQVDRRRPGTDERLRRPTQGRPAGVRHAGALLLGAHRQADGGDLADGRRAPHDHLADRVGDLPGIPARIFLEGIGKPALVDQIEDAAALAERGPEPGRTARRARCPDRVVTGRTEQLRRAGGVEDRAGRLRCALLEGRGGAGDGHGRLDQLDRQSSGRNAAARDRPQTGSPAAHSCPRRVPPTRRRWTGSCRLGLGWGRSIASCLAGTVST